jgi:hypothetical protein
MLASAFSSFSSTCWRLAVSFEIAPAAPEGYKAHAMLQGMESWWTCANCMPKKAVQQGLLKDPQQLCRLSSLLPPSVGNSHHRTHTDQVLYHCRTTELARLLRLALLDKPEVLMRVSATNYIGQHGGATAK